MTRRETVLFLGIGKSALTGERVAVLGSALRKLDPGEDV
jgi:hypothetical protein